MKLYNYLSNTFDYVVANGWSSKSIHLISMSAESKRNLRTHESDLVDPILFTNLIDLRPASVRPASVTFEKNHHSLVIWLLIGGTAFLLTTFRNIGCFREKYFFAYDNPVHSRNPVTSVRFFPPIFWSLPYNKIQHFVARLFRNTIN